MMFLSKKALEEINDKINTLQNTLNQYERCRECGGLFDKYYVFRVACEHYLDDDIFPTTYDIYYCNTHRKNYDRQVVHEKGGKREEKFYRTTPEKKVEVKQ